MPLPPANSSSARRRFGLILGALYSETGYDQKSIQDRVGILFFFTINQTFSNM
jgi:hypothetical protein